MTETARNKELREYRGLSFATEEELTMAVAILEEISLSSPFEVKYDFVPRQADEVIVMSNAVYALISDRLTQEGIGYSHVPIIPLNTLTPSEQAARRYGTLLRRRT